MCGQPVWKVGRCIRRHTFCQQRQKVCKKRRLNLRFKDPLARPVPFRPLGCVPHSWECFARGFKCRIIPAMALILQNIRCMFLMFSCRRGHRPRRRQDKPIQLPFPPKKKQSRTSHALLCSSHASSQNIEPQHHDAEDNQHNPRRAVERLRRGLIREHRRDPRPEEREHHAQRQHRPVRRAADGEV